MKKRKRKKRNKKNITPPDFILEPVRNSQFNFNFHLTAETVNRTKELMTPLPDLFSKYNIPVKKFSKSKTRERLEEFVDFLDCAKFSDLYKAYLIPFNLPVNDMNRIKCHCDLCKGKVDLPIYVLNRDRLTELAILQSEFVYNKIMELDKKTTKSNEIKVLWLDIHTGTFRHENYNFRENLNFSNTEYQIFSTTMSLKQILSNCSSVSFRMLLLACINKIYSNFVKGIYE